MVDYDVSIRCGDVLVHSGELVFADFDGIVVAPREAEKEVFRLAHEKVGAENSTRRELLEGKTLQEVRCAMIHKKPWTNQGFLVD